MSELAALRTRARDLVVRLARGARDDAARDALLSEIARAQAIECAPFARLCAARAARFDAGPDAWPALPTDVFRHARVASFPPGREARVFLTSGTTSGARGRHALPELGLYDVAAAAAAERALFRDEGSLTLVMLVPHPSESPESSLSYMLGRFEEWFARETVWAMRGGALDLAALRRALAAPGRKAVLGTSFALVHLDERLPAGERFELGEGGFVMQTGGYKGRSRELDAAAMRAMLAERFGVPAHRVVSEYGMTELSSQMYGRGLLDGALPPSGDERLWVPGWVRATPVDPERLAPVPEGETGILRIDDCANLWSVCSVQTADLARREGDSIVLLGRARGATPRGCSLAAEEALGAS